MDATSNIVPEASTTDYEYGYSHEKRIAKDGGYAPIENFMELHWYPTEELAEAARSSDRRWRLPTFLIRRPKPQPAERF